MRRILANDILLNRLTFLITSDVMFNAAQATCFCGIHLRRTVIRLLSYSWWRCVRRPTTRVLAQIKQSYSIASRIPPARSIWQSQISCCDHTNKEANKVKKKQGNAPTPIQVRMQLRNLLFENTRNATHLCFKAHETHAIFYSIKYRENKIGSAGPAQPAQRDRLHQISFWKTFEMLDIVLFQ